jgi:hypothetical protein
MRILVFVLPLLVTNVVFTPSGFADSSTGDPRTAGAATSEPVFAMMDNTGDRSKLEITLASGVMPSRSDGMFLGGRMVAQHVWPKGYGLYGTAMPTRSRFGGLDIGVLFHTAMSSNSSIGARIGVATPSLDDDDTGIPWLPNAMMQPADLILGLDTTAVRLGLSPTYRGQAGFLRLDLGVDIAPEGVGLILVHGNLGAGIRRDRVSATAELQSVFALAGDSENAWFGAAGVSARLHCDAVSPFVMVAKPFGSTDEFGRLFEGVFTVTVGFALEM